MKEALINVLNTTFDSAYPIFLQGTYAQDEPYPAAFFTFWNNSTRDFDTFDNETIGYVWDFDVNFYATDPTLVNTVLETAKAALKNAGWLISGVGYDVASDEPTHTGRGMNALYIQILEEPTPTPTPEPTPEPEPEPDEET